MTEDEAMEMFIKAIMSHDGSPMAKDGDFYWGKLGDKWMVINSIVWSDGTVKYFLDGAEIKITDEELARPVLTPDDVAAKDAEIERLQEALGEIEYREQPQNRGRPYRISIREVAQSALHEARSMVK